MNVGHAPTTRSRTISGVALAAVLSIVAAVLGAVPASAAPGDLGPTVSYTGAAPTGYSVTFRYEAPAGVNTVQIYGEWLFSKPSSIVFEAFQSVPVVKVEVESSV